MSSKEMFQKPGSKETERIVQGDLRVVNFATIIGVKGTQFGREVFSSLLKLKDLSAFLEVFPEVQRSASTRKVNQIKNYVVSGIEDKTNMRFFSGITLTARGGVFYDEISKSIAIDTITSKLSINDGQHRYLGINEALKELEKRRAKAKNEDAFELYTRYIDELGEMIIPVTLFNGIREDEEKQLFYDLNNLASRPSRSATIRLAQTDLFSKMARELSEENHYLLKYGVEQNKMSIHSSNLNTILLTTVYVFCRNLSYQEIRHNSDFLTEKNYEATKKEANRLLNLTFDNLPKDMNAKNKYILSKGYGLRGISMFIYESIHRKVPEDKVFEAIKNVQWEEDISYWSMFGAVKSEQGVIQFAGHGEGGNRAIMNACNRELNDLI